MSLQDYLDLFESKTKISKSLWQEASGYLPGGVAGSSGFLAPHPIYIEKAVGGKLIDVDGNEYIDLLLGGFLNILGHSPKPVTEAVKAQLDRGTSYMLFQETGVKLAKKMKEHIPHLERIRFCNTGSEATMFAVRAARSWTQKNKIAKPEGGYNGQHDLALISGASGRIAGPDQSPTPIADCAGIPPFIVENSIVFPWNDIDATVAIIEKHANELAAVIIEPMQGWGSGSILAEKAYMEALRSLTRKYNIVLIFDEIATGFRLGAMGGAANYYGLAPDISCFGKVIGGGFPVGAFGGRKDIMEKTTHPLADPEYKIFQSGTFSGNPVAMTAGLACLTELEKKDFDIIDGFAERLRRGFSKLAQAHGFDLQMTGACSILYPHFNTHPLRSVRDKLKDDVEKNREFCLGLVVNGVFFPPGHPAATCFAHAEADVDQILDTAENVFKEMNSS